MRRGGGRSLATSVSSSTNVVAAVIVSSSSSSSAIATIEFSSSIVRVVGYVASAIWRGYICIETTKKIQAFRFVGGVGGKKQI
jgi:hypothetical protein